VDNLELTQNDTSMVYLAIDADDAGRLVGQAVLGNDEAKLHEVSSNIDHGQDVIKAWVEQVGGKIVSFGGDECTAKIPSSSIEHVEQLRSDYQFATGMTITVGVGSKLSEAGKSLMAGKFRGKDQTVQYDESVEKDLQAGQQHVSDGSASEEEKKISEAYLNAPTSDHNHTENCEYCKEDPSKLAKEDDHGHTDDCQYCKALTEEPDHEHSDDCQYCKEADEKLSSHDHTDDCEYCKQSSESEQKKSFLLHSSEDEHEHTDDCKYCAENQSSANVSTGDVTAEMIANHIMTDDPNTQDEKIVMDNIDPSEMPLGDEMEDNVSRPEDYDENNSPTDMGLSEENESVDISNVSGGDLDAHKDGMQKEQIVNLIAESLDGFKANKQILEKAKDQAPELYAATISMLKAMIEMAKMLDLKPAQPSVEQQPSGQNPQQAAPQEGAAQAPQH